MIFSFVAFNSLSFAQSWNPPDLIHISLGRSKETIYEQPENPSSSIYVSEGVLNCVKDSQLANPFLQINLSFLDSNFWRDLHPLNPLISITSTFGQEHLLRNLFDVFGFNHQEIVSFSETAILIYLVFQNEVEIDNVGILCISDLFLWNLEAIQNVQS